MQKERFIVAIEIGSSKAKIGVAGFDPTDKNKRLTVYNSASIPTVDSVRYGRIHNQREVTEIVSELLNTVQKKYPIEGRNILGAYISIGGRSLKSHKLSAEILLPERCEIGEELLERLENEAVRKLSTNDELISIEPVRFKVDNLVTPRPVGSKGSRLAAEYTAITCNPANKADILEVISNRVGLNVRGISVRPMAVAHLVLSPQETKAGCMLVDFGAETITVSIYKDYGLQYLATIPIGSRLITLDLAKVLALTEEEAEKIKITQGDALPEKSNDVADNPDRENINSIITARLADIVANINAQSQFADMPLLSLPAGIILTGGGARMKNFARLLDSVMHLKVRIATLPSEIEIIDTELASPDNTDLIALINEGVDSARTNNDPECVTAPAVRQAVPIEPENKETEILVDFTSGGKKRERETVEDSFTFEHPQWEAEDDTSSPSKTTGDVFAEQDDNDWLTDRDNEETNRRTIRAEELRKQEEERQKREKKLREDEAELIRRLREQEKKEKKDTERKPEMNGGKKGRTPSKKTIMKTFDFYIHKFQDFITKEGEDNSEDM